MKEKILRKLEALYFSGEREIPLMKRLANSNALDFFTNSQSSGKINEERIPEMKKVQDPQKELDQIRADIGDCKRCCLCNERTKIVFGVGNPQADLMFVGEAPGQDEDRKGEPFVGRAGQLLTKIIQAMQLQREDVYIANVVKCRPPNNRNPTPEEIETCEPFLLRQIEVIQPKLIVCLGTFAAQTLLQTDQKISHLRGTFIPWPSAVVKAKFETKIPEKSICLMPTYHPAFLLRNPNMKRVVWEDMQKVMQELGIEK